MKKTIVIILAILFVFASISSAFAQSQGSCQKKAQETLDNMGKWIDEYNKQMTGADPSQKGKYEEWIRELEKLRSMVEQAVDKLSNDKACGSGSGCASDQCDLVDIADQQVTRLIKETEEQLGSSSKFGSSETGREATFDEDTLGNDEILNRKDSDDALQPNYAEESDGSDVKEKPGFTDYNDDPDNPDTADVEPSNPKEEASPF